MSTVVIFIIVVLIIIYGIRSFSKKVSSGNCCGSCGTPNYFIVSDRNKSHYPFRKTMTVEGMSCQNCTVYVENALNRLDGVWARVDYQTKTADVLMKTDIQDNELLHAVFIAGYRIKNIHKEK